ncbi:MAG: hypothetical protein H7301_02050 [Cryobacterium sp.]|nr:hypothetical protein [Oligoflexia bacterium]
MRRHSILSIKPCSFICVTAAIFLVSIAGAAEKTPTFPAPDGPLSILHSHNDFAQEHPLDTALENGITSVEADVTDRRGEVRVVHLGLWTYGSLKDLYLDRLQKLVDEKGSVYGDGKKFTLWIEMRPFITSRKVVPLLRSLLSKYPMLAQYGKDGKEVKPGPVTAVLMNVHSRDYFDGLETAPACLTVSRAAEKDQPNASFQCYVHFRWASQFTWMGNGEMPRPEIEKLRMLQRDAHSRGLRTRYWGIPDHAEFWKRALTLPFDLVGTDQLHQTRLYLAPALPHATLPTKKLPSAEVPRGLPVGKGSP